MLDNFKGEFMKKTLITLMALILASSGAYAASGDGIRVRDTEVNLSTYDGSMTMTLDVGDSFSYRLLNDGSNTTAVDVFLDLGNITSGVGSLTDGQDCFLGAPLTGLKTASQLGVDATSAQCKAFVVGVDRYVRLHIPLKATLSKAGAGTVNVTYSIPVNTFQFLDLKDNGSGVASCGGSCTPATWSNLGFTGLTAFNDVHAASGSSVINSAVTMSNNESRRYQLEIAAQLAGAGALSHYEAVMEVDVAP